MWLEIVSETFGVCLPAFIAREFALEVNVTFVIQVDSLKEIPTS